MVNRFILQEVSYICIYSIDKYIPEPSIVLTLINSYCICINGTCKSLNILVHGTDRK